MRGALTLADKSWSFTGEAVRNSSLPISQNRRTNALIYQGASPRVNLRAAVDIGYFRPDETIIAEATSSESLFVIIKGQVQERDGSETVGLLGPKDSFDARALVHGKSGHGFVAPVGFVSRPTISGHRPALSAGDAFRGAPV